MSRPVIRRAGTAFAVTAVALAFFATVAGASVLFDSPDDADIPGVAIPSSPFASSLTATTAVGLEDFDDVYAIPLRYNELLSLDMELLDDPATDDFDLVLYGPATKKPVLTAYQNSAWVAISQNEEPGGSEAIRFVSNSAPATYYAHVYCLYADGDTEAGGYGQYRMEWSRRQLAGPAVSVAAPSLAYYNATVPVAGAATLGGVPQANLRYDVFMLPTGATRWTRVASGYTGADGRYSTSVRARTKAVYRVRTAWGERPGGTIGWGNSRLFTITPRAYLALAAVPSAARVSTSFGLNGYIRPLHTAGRGHVKILAQRWANGAWGSSFYTNADNTTGTFSANLKLPAKGVWRLQARVPADGLHAATYSAWRTVKVY